MTAIATSLPATLFSVALSSASCSAVSACAEVTSAAVSPRASAAMRAECLDHGGDREQAAVLGHHAQEIAGEARDAGLVEHGAIAFDCSSAENTGLLIRRTRSALEFSSDSKLPRSCSTWGTAFASAASSKSEPA